MSDLRDVVYSIRYNVNDAGIDQASDNADDLADRIDGASDNVNELNSNASETGNVFGKVGKVVAAAFAVDKIIDFGKAIIQTGGDFEQSMANVRAVMMPTEKEFKILSDAAKEAGATTKFSAKESADALYFMASAGYDASTSAEALSGLLNLAAAGQMEIAQTSELAASAMSTMGLKASELTNLADIMAMTARKSNTNIAQLGEGMLEVGGVSKSMGEGVESVATWLGIMADNGKKAAEGGTGLRNIMLNLTAPNKQNADLLKELNVKLIDSNGNFLSLQKILKNLKTSMNGFTEAEQQAIKEQLAGKENIQSLNILLDNSSGRYDELTNSISKSAGASKEMADIQMNTLFGSYEELTSAIEGTMINVSENTQANETFKQIIKDIIGVMPEFEAATTSAFGAALDAVIFLKNNAQTLGYVVSFLSAMWAANTVITIANTIARIANTEGTALNTAITIAKTAAIVGLTAAELSGSVAVGIMTAAQWAFNAALSANPIGLVIIAIGALGAAIYGIITHWESIKKSIVDTWKKINDNPIGQFILLMNPFTGALKLVTDNFDAISDAIKRAWDWLTFWDDESEGGRDTPQRVNVDGKEFSAYATGTYNTPDSFIAGENGPELITNAPNRRVYKASETTGIMGGGKSVSMENNINIIVNGAEGDVSGQIKTALNEFFGDLEVQMAL